jgi:osmotically-inducible protein OsmY
VIGAARIVALGLAIAGLPACELAVVGAGSALGVAAIEDRRPGSVQIEDEGIELRVGNRISERFGDKVHVSVTSYNRAVLLTGEVPDQQAGSEVEKIAAGVPGVRSVTNDVQRAKPSSDQSRINDAFITGKVKARFVDAGRFNALHVKVVTEAGVVYLMGIVTEKEATDAVEIARTTGGVRKVVKVFEYCKPADTICRPGGRPAAGERKPAGG